MNKCRPCEGAAPDDGAVIQGGNASRRRLQLRLQAVCARLKRFSKLGEQRVIGAAQEEHVLPWAILAPLACPAYRLLLAKLGRGGAARNITQALGSSRTLLSPPLI